MNSFARYICWTYNNPSDEDVAAIKLMLAGKCEYAVFGKETAASGTPHLQGYMELPAKPRARLGTVKKWFPDGVHLERRKGTGKQASDYCKKGAQSHIDWELDGCDSLRFGHDADVWEHGELSVMTERKRTDIDTVRSRILSGEVKNEFDLLMEVGSMQALRFGQTFLNNMPVPVVRERPLVYWISGPTGSGKSHSCAQIVQRLVDVRGWSFWRSNGTPKWFDGYNRQEIVWFDDYRFTGSSADFAYMLNLLDVYPLRVPIKGGFVTWTPRVILFTAPKNVVRSFESISEREDVTQMERRISQEFDFADGGHSTLAVAIWSYMEDPTKHYAPVQKFGEIDFEDDEEYDADDDDDYVLEAVIPEDDEEYDADDEMCVESDDE